MKHLIFFLLLAASAFGQGSFIPPQTAFKTVNGITAPLSSATITVCPALAGGIPCSPVTIAIFNDAALTQPLSNPFTADAQGNYIFAAAAGTYTVTVSGTGFNGYSYQVSVGSAQGAPVNQAASPGIGYPVRFMYLFGDNSGTFQLGTNNAPTKVGTETGQTPTATETAGDQFASAAAGSTNVTAAIGHNQGAGLNGSNYSFGTTVRYAVRLKPITTTNARYWIGFVDVNGPSDYSSAVYASDAPARFYCAFRFSATTDTTWKAICATDATHQTIIDTGITPVTTSSTLFEIFPTPGMTAVTFYINGALVATVNSNLPTNANRPATAWMADNKNTATSVGAIFYWSQTFYSK